MNPWILPWWILCWTVALLILHLSVELKLAYERPLYGHWRPADRVWTRAVGAESCAAPGTVGEGTRGLQCQRGLGVNSQFSSLKPPRRNSSLTCIWAVLCCTHSESRSSYAHRAEEENPKVVSRLNEEPS